MALRSMTGFASVRSASGRFLVDVKSVNHRFLDISLRLPPGLESTEAEIIRCVKVSLRRAKVSLNIGFSPDIELPLKVPTFSHSLFHEAFSVLDKDLSQYLTDNCRRAEIISTHLLNKGEIFSFVSSITGRDEHLAELMECVNEGLRQLNISRDEEGSALEEILNRHLLRFEELISCLLPLCTQSVERFRHRLTQRLKSAEVNFSEEQLTSEIVLVAERTEITEEIDRLANHITQLRAVLAAGGEAGKKLDFFAQEMLREINTVGSKSWCSEISTCVIEAKFQLEKIREQSQNIE